MILKPGFPSCPYVLVLPTAKVILHNPTVFKDKLTAKGEKPMKKQKYKKKGVYQLTKQILMPGPAVYKLVKPGREGIQMDLPGNVLFIKI
ncbi:MAG: hypothetical protein U0T82_00440 [Bacteroidales bacterium]